MYWAKELRFEGNSVNTLNYNIRILGKEGVLVLNAVATMSQLKTIEAEAPAILGFVNFTPGNNYTDYKEGTHQLAGYGLAGLVAAGVGLKVAAKVGFLKMIIGFLIAMKKFLVVLVAGALAAVKRIFFGRKKEVVTDEETTK